MFFQSLCFVDVSNIDSLDSYNPTVQKCSTVCLCSSCFKFFSTTYSCNIFNGNAGEAGNTEKNVYDNSIHVDGEGNDPEGYFEYGTGDMEGGDPGEYFEEDGDLGEYFEEDPLIYEEQAYPYEEEGY